MDDFHAHFFDDKGEGIDEILKIAGGGDDASAFFLEINDGFFEFFIDQGGEVLVVGELADEGTVDGIVPGVGQGGDGDTDVGVVGPFDPGVFVAGGFGPSDEFKVSDLAEEEIDGVLTGFGVVTGGDVVEVGGVGLTLLDLVDDLFSDAVGLVEVGADDDSDAAVILGAKPGEADADGQVGKLQHAGVLVRAANDVYIVIRDFHVRSNPII